VQLASRVYGRPLSASNAAHNERTTDPRSGLYCKEDGSDNENCAELKQHALSVLEQRAKDGRWRGCLRFVINLPRAVGVLPGAFVEGDDVVLRVDLSNVHLLFADEKSPAAVKAAQVVRALYGSDDAAPAGAAGGKATAKCRCTEDGRACGSRHCSCVKHGLPCNRACACHGCDWCQNVVS
jgi:hypothetical protein